MPSDVELFLSHVEGVIGAQATSFHKVPGAQPGLPPVTAIFFEDLPNPGALTAVTYGLSHSDHPDWKHGRPELMISVESTDKSWGYAIAEIAESYRGDWAFSYGSTVNFREEISDESPMTGFLIFAPSLVDRALEQRDYTIQLSKKKLFLAGMYPLHAGELELFNRIGLERFWKLPDFDPYDVNRPDLSLLHRDN